MRSPRSESWRAAGSVGYVFGALGAEAAPGPVLVGLLGDLGVSAESARTVLARMVRSGQLASEPHGRLSLYRLAGTYRDQFLRVLRGDRRAPSWSGAFDSVVYDVPERRRGVRDELRAVAFAQGFGSPRPGVLIGFADPSAWLARVALTDDCYAEVAQLGCDLATARRLVSHAWPLDELAATVDDQLVRFADLADRPAATDLDAFRVHHLATNQLAGTTIALPPLPPELMPEGWRADLIPAAYGAVSERVWPGAERHVEAVRAGSPYAELLVPLVDVERAASGTLP